MNAAPPMVLPNVDQEHVASLAIDAGVSAVPVVDAAGHLLGCVPAQALIAILRREHIEDMQRLVGIRQSNSQALHAISATPLTRARERLPWLLVGLAGSIVATFIMSRFEQTLAAQLTIAFFVPGIVYLADAIGTQSEVIAVRGLSFNQAPLLRLVLGELATGMLIGLALGLLALPVAWLAFERLAPGGGRGVVDPRRRRGRHQHRSAATVGAGAHRGRPGARLRARRDHHSGRLEPAGLFRARQLPGPLAATRLGPSRPNALLTCVTLAAGKRSKFQKVSGHFHQAVMHPWLPLPATGAVNDRYIWSKPWRITFITFPGGCGYAPPTQARRTARGGGRGVGADHRRGHRGAGQ